MSSYKSVVLADNPIAYWPMGEASGNLTDATGNGNTATTHNSPTYGLASPIVGNTNTAIGFANASSTFFSVASVAGLAIVAAVTLEAWVLLTGVANGVNHGIVFKGNSSFGICSPYALYITRNGSGGTFQFARGNNAVGATINAGMATSNGSWHHIAAIMAGGSGTLASILIDGVLANSGTITTTIADNGDPLDIGSRGTGAAALDGDICHLAVYSVALTAAQVANHFNVGIAGAQGTGTPYLSWLRQ